MSKDEDVIREISFNSLNYSVTVKSNCKEDNFDKLKKIALDVLKDIQEV